MTPSIQSFSTKALRISFSLLVCLLPEPRDTAGAIRHALPLLSTETALVLNGDSYVEADLGVFLAFHRRRGAVASLVAVSIADAARFGRIETDGEGRILRFLEKSDALSSPGKINAGIYLLQRSLVATIPEGRRVSIERETFPSLCGRGLYAWAGEFPFLDIGTPESYALAEEFFRIRSAPK